MNKIYLVEYYLRQNMDSADIPVEDAFPVGYFSGKKQVEKALRTINAYVPKENVRVTEYPLTYGNAQQDVYVLMYEYYTTDTEGLSEYYYTFPPCTSQAVCETYRANLSATPKYAKTPSKQFYESADGFRILRYAINALQPLPALD